MHLTAEQTGSSPKIGGFYTVVSCRAGLKREHLAHRFKAKSKFEKRAGLFVFETKTLMVQQVTGNSSSLLIVFVQLKRCSDILCS